MTSRAYQLEHVRVSQSLPLAVSWALTAAEESAPGLSRQLSELAGEVKAEVLHLGTRPQQLKEPVVATRIADDPRRNPEDLKVRGKKRKVRKSR